MRVFIVNPRSDSERGATAVLIAILVTLLAGMTAFVADFGMAYATKRQLSVAADAAALAAAQHIAERLPPSECSISSALRDEAQDLARAVNRDRNSPDARLDTFNAGCFSDSKGEYVEVAIENSKDTPVFFGGLWGKSGPYTPARSAVARIYSTNEVSGLRPFAVCHDVVEEAQNNQSSTYSIILSNQTGVCNTTASGNWGTVDFDGDANKTPDLVSWILDGYPGRVTLPDPTLPADPGMPGPGAVDTALDSLINKIIMIPVVTRYTSGGNDKNDKDDEGKGGGNNASFDAIGIMAMQFCGYRLNSKVNSTGACWDQLQANPLLATSPSVDFIQFRFRNYVTSSYNGPGSRCATFGSVGCVRAVQLYK